MKLKRSITVMLALSMLLGLAACGAPTPAPAADGKATEAAAATAAAGDSKPAETAAAADPAAPDTSKFVDIVWYSLGDVPTNDQLDLAKAEWDKILKEKVNASLTFKFIPWTDWTTQYNLKFASGEAFDMINTATDWLGAWQNAQRGAFRKLDDLLPTYAPVTYNEVPQTDWDQCKYNGEIIMIPENSFTQWINHGFTYRGDWAKEAGLTVPLTSWDDIEKYCQWIKDNKPDVIPYDTDGSTGIGNENFYGYVYSNTDSIQIDPVTVLGLYFSRDYDHITEAYSPIFEDVMVKYATQMKKWGDAGFWREDVLNYKGDNWEAMKIGKSGLKQHITQSYKGERVDMDEKQPGSELMFMDFCVQGKKNLCAMTITHGAQSIPINAPNPERTLMVYDLVRNDPEVYKLINYGREGVQYEIKDGVRTRPAAYDETRDKFYTDFWGGRVDKNEIPTDRDWADIGKLYAEYDTYKKPFAYPGFVWDQTPVASEVAAVEGVYNAQMTAISFGKAGEPQAAVDKLRNDLKAAGIDKVLEELNKQLAAWKAAQ